MAVLCLPFASGLALTAEPALASQEAANPWQPNPVLVDPVLANPIPTQLMPPDPPLPDAVRAMIDAAFTNGEDADVEAVVRLARMTNAGSIREIDALIAYYQSAYPPAVQPDPVTTMLAAAIASGKDADVEAVAKLAAATNPDHAAEIDTRLVAYRAERKRLKDEAAAAERARLAAAKIWQNWKGEGQIGATLSTGNTSSRGLSAGLALARKGLDWNYKFRAQADYQRTNGRTSVERFLTEVEPQYKVSDRAFAFGLARWEQDRVLGYDTRWNVSGGLGYKAIDGKTMSLSLKGGPTWQRIDYITGPTDSELAALAGIDFGWQLSPTLRLTQVASTIVGERNMATSSLTAINAKLTGALSARLAYSAELDTNPPPGIEKVDTLTRFTLVYGF
jgi:putative salt-induced outer membrane protein